MLKNQKLKEKIKKLIEEQSVILLRNKNFSAFPDDIDILCDIEKRAAIEKFLLKMGFNIIYKDSFRTMALIMQEQNFFILDCIYDFSYIAKDYGIKLTDKFIQDLKEDKDSARFARYALMRRRGKKHISFIEENFDLYINYLKDGVYFKEEIFKDLSKENLLKALKGSRLYYFYIFRPKYLLLIFLSFLNFVIKRLGKGKLVAVLGTDGSGKSTITKKLSQLNGVRRIYMGDRQFKLQKFYDFFLEKNIKLAGLIFLPMIVEQYLRILKAKFLSFAGYRVITDRYPNYNDLTCKEGTKKKILKLLQRIFPKADIFVFLLADESIIQSKLPELSDKEIIKRHDCLKSMLKTKKHKVIENKNIDDALNKLIKILFQ